MYKARFNWLQNTDFPVYKDLLSYIVEDSSTNGSAGSISRGNFDASSKTREINLDLDITEDFTYEIKSNFENYGEALGNLSSFASTILGYVEGAAKIQSLGGTAANTDWLRFQVWKDTEPFKMSFKFMLFTKTDPFIDVYAPAMALSSMTILSPVVNSSNNTAIFYTPGVNGQGMRKLKKDTGAKPPASSKPSRSDGKSLDTSTPEEQEKKSLIEESRKYSKLIEEFVIWAYQVEGSSLSLAKGNLKTTIPGIPLLGVKNCFIESAKPTWSRDRTASGIPLWCEMEVSIQSIYSASDAIFSYVSKNTNVPIINAGVVATNIFR